MAFTTDQLLITPARLAQLQKALSSLGVADPMAQCIAEAEAEVDRLTSGYEIAEASRTAWVRIAALYKAYSLAEAVPADIKSQYEAAIKELTAISNGERKNLTQIDGDDAEVAPGGWGSGDKVL